MARNQWHLQQWTCTWNLSLKNYRCHGKVWKYLIHYKAQYSIKGYVHNGTFMTSQHMDFLQVLLPKVLWDAHLVAQLKKHNLLINLKNHFFVGVIVICQGFIPISSLKCFQWGNRKHDGSHVNCCIRYCKVGQGMWNMATMLQK